MDILAKGKRSSHLFNPEPDDQLQEILKGSKFEDNKLPPFIAWQLNSVCNSGCLHCLLGGKVK
jgi:hypothetical protein